MAHAEQPVVVDDALDSGRTEPGLDLAVEDHLAANEHRHLGRQVGPARAAPPRTVGEVLLLTEIDDSEVDLLRQARPHQMDEAHIAVQRLDRSFCQGRRRRGWRGEALWEVEVVGEVLTHVALGLYQLVMSYERQCSASAEYLSRIAWTNERNLKCRQ